MAAISSRDVQNLSDQYEKITGKRGLLYVSRPGDGTLRYVFRDGVKVGTRKALDYITAELAKAKK